MLLAPVDAETQEQSLTPLLASLLHPTSLPPACRRRFQCEGPFWGRQYLFWHDGKPLTLIYEVFSNQLEQFLGNPRQPGI